MSAVKGVDGGDGSSPLVAIEGGPTLGLEAGLVTIFPRRPSSFGHHKLAFAPDALKTAVNLRPKKVTIVQARRSIVADAPRISRKAPFELQPCQPTFLVAMDDLHVMLQDFSSGFQV